AATVSAVGPKQGAVVENHAAVMILHRLRKPDFLRGKLPGWFLDQARRSTARPIGRSGEHLPIVINGRGDIEPHEVGGLVITPEQLAIGSGDSSDGHGQKLHVLTLAAKIYCDG